MQLSNKKVRFFLTFSDIFTQDIRTFCANDTFLHLYICMCVPFYTRTTHTLFQTQLEIIYFPDTHSRQFSPVICYWINEFMKNSDRTFFMHDVQNYELQKHGERNWSPLKNQTLPKNPIWSTSLYSFHFGITRGHAEGTNARNLL